MQPKRRIVGLQIDSNLKRCMLRSVVHCSEQSEFMYRTMNSFVVVVVVVFIVILFYFIFFLSSCEKERMQKEIGCERGIPYCVFRLVCRLNHIHGAATKEMMIYTTMLVVAWNFDKWFANLFTKIRILGFRKNFLSLSSLWMCNQRMCVCACFFLFSRASLNCMPFYHFFSVFFFLVSPIHRRNLFEWVSERARLRIYTFIEIMKIQINENNEIKRAFCVCTVCLCDAYCWCYISSEGAIYLFLTVEACWCRMAF